MCHVCITCKGCLWYWHICLVQLNGSLGGALGVCGLTGVGAKVSLGGGSAATIAAKEGCSECYRKYIEQMSVSCFLSMQ